MIRRKTLGTSRLDRRFAKGRLSFIDSFRGFAMVLVILQHYEFPYVGKYILSFHMPLFFAISGYLFNHIRAGEKMFADVVKSKAMQLLIPYFGFELIFLALSYCMMPIFHNEIVFSAAVKSIVLCINTEQYSGICERLWFLPCLYVSYVAMYGIYTLMNGCRSAYFYGVFVLLVFLSFAESNIIGQRMPFTLDIAIMGTAYMCLGYAAKEVVEQMRSLTTHRLSLLSAICLTLMIPAAYYNDTFYMYVNKYGNYPLSVVGASFGMAGFCAAVVALRKVYKPIQWLSYNTLVIFPLHLGIWFFVYTYYNKSLFMYTNTFYSYTTMFGNYLLAVIGSLCGVAVADLVKIYFDYLHFTVRAAIAIIVMIPCVQVINRHLPLLAGKPIRQN